MLMNYLMTGINTFSYMIPTAIIIFAIALGIKFLLKKTIKLHIPSMLCEFVLILIFLSILEITGIIGGSFGTTSPFDGSMHFSFSLFDEGLSTASLLNIGLFIPFGFFSPIVFKRIQSKWIYGILIGFIFSVTIEFLQTFTGRFVQVDDILMNTLGTFIGYEIWGVLSKKNHTRKKINNSYPIDYDNNL